jgi:release factor glutamine methyltransferase
MLALEMMKTASAAFSGRGMTFFAREAEAIVLHVTGIDKVTLLRENPSLSKRQMEEIEQSVKRRLRGEPLQYIIGSVEFYGLTLRVGRGVLIPRPETELLVEEVLKCDACRRGDESTAQNGTQKRMTRILDLCTGSGAIALAIAANCPHAQVYATEVSDTALTYALENAGITHISNVTFLRGNLYDPVQGMQFLLIVSNPPYIRTGEIRDLQVEIRDWEPREALDAGEDGLNYYRQILSQLSVYLMPGGFCFLEIGFDQKEDIENLARDYNIVCSFKKDLAGHHRIAILSLPG